MRCTNSCSPSPRWLTNRSEKPSRHGFRANARRRRASPSASTSSASSHRIQSPVAASIETLRASANEPFHGKWTTRAPNDSAISTVESVDPVSTTTISSTAGAAAWSERGSISSSSLTIMQSEIRSPSTGRARRASESARSARGRLLGVFGTPAGARPVRWRSFACRTFSAIPGSRLSSLPAATNAASAALPSLRPYRTTPSSLRKTGSAGCSSRASRSPSAQARRSSVSGFPAPRVAATSLRRDSYRIVWLSHPAMSAKACPSASTSSMATPPGRRPSRARRTVSSRQTRGPTRACESPFARTGT